MPLLTTLGQLRLSCENDPTMFERTPELREFLEHTKDYPEDQQVSLGMESIDLLAERGDPLDEFIKKRRGG